MSVEFKDNSVAVLAAMELAKKKTLTEIGLTAVEVTNDYMQTRYGRPIYQTGDLMRSIAFNVRTADDAVDVGSNLEYAPWVHNGTARTSKEFPNGRPFLRDAIMENKDIWSEIAGQEISATMK